MEQLREQHSRLQAEYSGQAKQLEDIMSLFDHYKLETENELKNTQDQKNMFIEENTGRVQQEIDELQQHIAELTRDNQVKTQCEEELSSLLGKKSDEY